MSKSKHAEFLMLLMLPGIVAAATSQASAQDATERTQQAQALPAPADADAVVEQGTTLRKKKQDKQRPDNRARENQAPTNNDDGVEPNRRDRQGQNQIKQDDRQPGQTRANDRNRGKNSAPANATAPGQEVPVQGQNPNRPERAQQNDDRNERRDRVKAERNNGPANSETTAPPVQANTPVQQAPPAVAEKPAVPSGAPVAPKAEKIEPIAPANKTVETPAAEKTQTGETKPPAEAPARADRPDRNRPAGVREDRKEERRDADTAKQGPVAARPTDAVAKETFVAPPKPVQTFEQTKKARTEKVTNDGKTRVIREIDKRVIIKQDNRVIIRNDESERFRRVARNATTSNRSDGSVETVYVRGDGIRVYNVVDQEGRILYRYRRDRENRDVMLIDNRRFYRGDRSDRNRNLAIGLGVGIAVGAAIVALAPPVISIPRDKYIVDYSRASEDDLYEALTAPPVERLDRSYSLEEIRYNAPVRERMRRIDVDTVTFDFGSWEVAGNQYDALANIAKVINRALDRNSGEIFLIEGHTDAVGSDDDNLTLSDRRAQAVAEILTSRFNVPPENIVTQGYGEEQLKVRTEEPERENRRIAFRRVTPLMSEQTQTQ